MCVCVLHHRNDSTTTLEYRISWLAFFSFSYCKKFYVLCQVLHVCCANMYLSCGGAFPLHSYLQHVYKTLKKRCLEPVPQVSRPTQFQRPLWCKRRHRFMGSGRPPGRSTRARGKYGRDRRLNRNRASIICSRWPFLGAFKENAPSCLLCR